MSKVSTLEALVERWADAKPAELANLQSYVIELCEALGVEPPRPAGGGYEFNFPIHVVRRDGTDTTNFVDLYKEGHFALEGKDDGTNSSERALRAAYGQVRGYAGFIGEPPPYLLVLDVAKTLIIWDRWSGDYPGWDGSRRVDLRTLHQRPGDVELLRDIWTNPEVRNTHGKAVAVTREIAEQLAILATSLEAEGFEHARVARFLIRCVFTMFAEDIGLLPQEPFRKILEKLAMAEPTEFKPQVEQLWKVMDTGGSFWYLQLMQFNGHFYKDAEALPLSRKALSLLLAASRADWQHVEPAILGTLLVRALSAAERHRLGAEFTPRVYVERVIRQAVEEPIRERWTAVQAEILELRESSKPKNRRAAGQKIETFLTWLRGLRFLDPACGSGNFLYVAMHAVKRIELEATRALADVDGQNLSLRMTEVRPSQFYGIELEPWAREIAELTLWIGFHQFWKQHHDERPTPPFLEDSHNLEQRDAVLAWDGKLRPDGPRSRPDPRPRLLHPVTGKLIPDPKAILTYWVYPNARPAPWPPADFIVGNPPYMGQARQRDAFGDGYVEALRAAYPELADSVDYVMYWWYRAAEEVAAGRTIRAGLITTNTITQVQNRSVVAMEGKKGAQVVWAIADHPWVDDTIGAAVRVAMTVIALKPSNAVLEVVDDAATVIRKLTAPQMNADLSVHADVARASGVPLLANVGLASRGFKLHGSGFVLTTSEAKRVRSAERRYRNIVRPYRNGKDITDRPRTAYVIDFGLADEVEARRSPIPFDILRDRVRPERLANARATYRKYWWRFGEPRREFREASRGLKRYIATPQTAKHRFFVFLDVDIAPDDMLLCVASDDAFVLGVVSSSIHVAWADATGGRMGVGNDSRYMKSACFDAFPFPTPPPILAREIGEIAEAIDAHRKEAVGRDEGITMTGLYNVVAKLRACAGLTSREQLINALGACGSLRDLHDRLDSAVAKAYGWSTPTQPSIVLERLVALHDQRKAEEEHGLVRWIRPEFQAPGSDEKKTPKTSTQLGIPLVPSRSSQPILLNTWSTETVDQIALVKALLSDAELTASEMAVQIADAPLNRVEKLLDALVTLGELSKQSDGKYSLVQIASAGAAF
jgi:hypothetical protein